MGAIVVRNVVAIGLDGGHVPARPGTLSPPDGNPSGIATLSRGIGRVDALTSDDDTAAMAAELDSAAEGSEASDQWSPSSEKPWPLM